MTKAELWAWKLAILKVKGDWRISIDRLLFFKIWSDMLWEVRRP